MNSVELLKLIDKYKCLSDNIVNHTTIKSLSTRLDKNQLCMDNNQLQLMCKHVSCGECIFNGNASSINSHNQPVHCLFIHRYSPSGVKSELFGKHHFDSMNDGIDFLNELKLLCEVLRGEPLE